MRPLKDIEQILPHIVYFIKKAWNLFQKHKVATNYMYVLYMNTRMNVIRIDLIISFLHIHKYHYYITV